MKWGENLRPGEMVEVWNSNKPGFIVDRDPEHVHLWTVLHENVIQTVHSSKLRILQS